MKLLWTRLTGVSPTVETVGWATSLVVHAVGVAVASAAFFTVASSSPQLPGDRLRTAIELTAELHKPEVPPPVAIQPSELALVVRPSEARIATRKYTQESPDVSQPTAAEVAWAERLLAEPVAAPSEPQRAAQASSRVSAGSPAESQPPHRAARAVPVSTVEVKSAPAAASRPMRTGNTRQTPPRLRDNRPPEYPPQAHRAGVEGTVLLRVLVAADGEVSRVQILESSGHSILDAAAVRAVRSWQYIPAQRGGQPVATTIRQPVRFTLRDCPSPSFSASAAMANSRLCDLVPLYVRDTLYSPLIANNRLRVEM